MTGKGHLITAPACLLLADAAIDGIGKFLTDRTASMSLELHLKAMNLFPGYQNWMLRVWLPDFIYDSKLHTAGAQTAVLHNTATTPVTILVCLIWILYLALFLFGALLPDIDSECSMLGRYFHLPVEHHRITHTVWFLLPLLIIGIWVPPVWWIGIGYFTHLFIDSLGRAGNCWFYPMEKYLQYDSGAFVKKGHWLKLYRTGKFSETIVCIIFVALAVLCTVLRFLG